MTDSVANISDIRSLSYGCHFYFHIIGTMNNTEAIAAFLALGQETRLNVFRLIVQRGQAGLTPSALIEQLAIPQATLSFHLKELVRAHLLLVERQGRQLIYRPNAVLVENLSDFLLENCCGGQSCSPRTQSTTLSTP
jgi:ArsR family transcriptional regulator